MRIEDGLSRVVLTLKDETRRIRGSECTALQADAELGVVNLEVGSSGSTAIERYVGVQHVLVEGRVDRVLKLSRLGHVTLDYPNRLVIADFDLTDGTLGLAMDETQTIERDITMLGINRS